MTAHQLAHTVADLALNKQGEDIVILDLQKLTTIADYFVIVTGHVDVHVKAVADNISRELLKSDEPVKPLHVEGYSHLNWILMDFGDVVVHIFLPETRKYYQLEQLWGDAPSERVEDTAEGRT